MQGIQQASRRILGGAAVPASEKLLSLFEPHTQVVPRFKAGKPVELGRKLRLDEVEVGSLPATGCWTTVVARTNPT
jgi:IS5 family transposase